jgi:hypothetical protein
MRLRLDFEHKINKLVNNNRYLASLSEQSTEKNEIYRLR